MSDSPSPRTDVDYAKVNGPPVGWQRLAVFDVETGRKISGVIEANAAEGWVVVMLRDADGKVMRRGDEKVTVRTHRAIVILRCHGCGAPLRPPPGWSRDLADLTLEVQP